MPTYDYKCDKCEKIEEQILPMCDSDIEIKCICGGTQRRFWSNPHCKIDCLEQDNPRWSDTMGINPDQIDEARKYHPDSVYDGEGRLLIKNRKHKLLEMKRRGYYD